MTLVIFLFVVLIASKVLLLFEISALTANRWTAGRLFHTGRWGCCISRAGGYHSGVDTCACQISHLYQCWPVGLRLVWSCASLSVSGRNKTEPFQGLPWDRCCFYYSQKKHCQRMTQKFCLFSVTFSSCSLSLQREKRHKSSWRQRCWRHSNTLMFDLRH